MDQLDAVRRWWRGAGIGQYRCAARKNTGTSQGNNTTQLQNFDTSVQDTDAMLQIGGAHPNRVTFTHAGIYLVHAQASSTGSGQMLIGITKNYESATVFPSPPYDWGGGYIGSPEAWTVQSFAAADYVSVHVYMGVNSGTVTSRAFAMSLF